MANLPLTPLIATPPPPRTSASPLCWVSFGRVLAARSSHSVSSSSREFHRDQGFTGEDHMRVGGSPIKSERTGRGGVVCVAPSCS